MRFVKSTQRLGFSLDDVADLLRLEDGTRLHWASSPAGSGRAERHQGETRGSRAHGDRAVPTGTRMCSEQSV
nr:MerR family DNA-binding protein [Paraburkholderia sp.]